MVEIKRLERHWCGYALEDGWCIHCNEQVMPKSPEVDNMEMNGMNEKQQVGLVVSLPQGVKEENFGDSIGRLLPKKGKDGGIIKTKNGEPVLSLALDLTNLRAMIEKHKLKATDKRSGHDIVWVTGFVSEIRRKAVSI